jgi:hypothetical protein
MPINVSTINGKEDGDTNNGDPPPSSPEDCAANSVTDAVARITPISRFDILGITRSPTTFPEP